MLGRLLRLPIRSSGPVKAQPGFQGFHQRLIFLLLGQDEGLPVMRRGVVEQAPLGQGVAEVKVGVRVGRLDFQRLPVVRMASSSRPCLLKALPRL